MPHDQGVNSGWIGPVHEKHLAFNICSNRVVTVSAAELHLI